MKTDAILRKTRERTIMMSAIEALGSHGVRGASLRDIAASAGVSLTLIHHHFGSKSSLVAAAIDSLLSVSAAPLARLQVELQRDSLLSPEQLASAWIQYLVDLFGGESKLPYLRMMQRLRSDPSIEESSRHVLDAAEPVIREAMRRTFPEASSASIDLVLLSSRGALVAALLEEWAGTKNGSAFEPARQTTRTALITFVAGAMTAAFAQDDARSSGGQGRPADEQEAVTWS